MMGIKGNRVKSLSLLLVIVLMLGIFPLAASGTSTALEVGTGKAYPTIQAAINSASSGDTILVCKGNYNEHINLNKTNLTLKAAEKHKTIINGGIQINADNATVDGFKIIGGWVPAPAGVDQFAIYILAGTSGHSITNNILTGPGTSIAARGVLFGYNTSNIKVRNNDISSWHSGIYINPSTSLTFEGNNIHQNYVGISSDGISDVSIIRNNFAANSLEGWGFSNGESRAVTNLKANYNNFVGNGTAIANYTGVIIDALSNWWGDASGPRGGASDPITGITAGGIGDQISANVCFDPWLTRSVSFSNYTLSITGPLSAAPGQAVEFSIRARGNGTGNTSYTAIYDYSITGGTGSLEYYDTSWKPLPLTGTFGPAGGFELTPDYDVTTAFRFTPDRNSRYEATVTLRTLEGKVLATAKYVLNRYEFEIPESGGETVKISPRTINMKSKRRWINIIVQIPEEYKGLNINKVYIPGTSEDIEAESFKVLKNGVHAKFKWSEVADEVAEILQQGDNVEITVLAITSGNDTFGGTGQIKVISPGNKNLGKRAVKKHP